jgi:tetratricopeptide (TPR) repeat protein
MKIRILKILLIVLLIAAGGYFVFRRFTPKVQDPALASMRMNLVQAVDGNLAKIPADQILKYQEELKKAQAALSDSNFENMQALGEVARYKKILGDFEGALTAWKYATLIHPESAFAFFNLAAIYQFDFKKYPEAESAYLSALVNDSKDFNTIRNFFELYEVDLKDSVKAEGLLLQGIKDNPEGAELYALLGKFYLDKGLKSQALDQFRKALKLNPENELIKKEINELSAQ